MTRSNRLLLCLALGIASLSAVAVSARAISSAFKPPTQPVIAVVDIEIVLKGLDERYWREQKLEGEVKAAQASIDEKVKKITEDQTAIEALPAGPQKTARQEELRKRAYQAKFDKEYSEQYLAGMKSDSLRELYDKITDACRLLAQKSGYTMIFSNDQSVRVPDGTIAEVSRAITLKRVLFVDPSHDVTQELIAVMNNAYVAAGGQPAPPAPPPTANPPKSTTAPAPKPK